jgi:hypothetical protein
MAKPNRPPSVPKNADSAISVGIVCIRVLCILRLKLGMFCFESIGDVLERDQPLGQRAYTLCHPCCSVVHQTASVFVRSQD